MGEPMISDKKPKFVELEPGQYWWCSCGQSKTQPFCDGTHKAAGTFLPVGFAIQAKRKVALCQCKHTRKAPFCDGSHNDL